MVKKYDRGGCGWVWWVDGLVGRLPTVHWKAGYGEKISGVILVFSASINVTIT